MAVTYGFYNSLNKDRVYNAEQMSSIFNGIITDGVFASIGGSLMPIAGTGMQVVVKTGKCWFNSTWTLNDALLPLDIPAADVSLTRIDAVVVEINSAVSTRANTIKIIKGTPSANPAKPTLANTETLHQYALGYITIGAGVTSITADKIEVNVGKTTCPFITSVLQQTDITALFNQWDAEFNAWFANVQAQLSGNVAANLQKQIDERVKVADKASVEDIVAGISDEKWVTPKIIRDGDIGYRVGDVLTTARANLGDKWLLCDGSIIDKILHPELFEIFKIDWLIGSALVANNGSDKFPASHACFYNGKWVTIGVGKPYGGQNTLFSWFSDTPTGKWTNRIIEGTDPIDIVTCLKVLNGNLIICGSCEVTSAGRHRARIWYTTDPTNITRSWSTKDITETIRYGPFVQDIDYGNGMYIAGCILDYNRNGAIFISNSLYGDWSQVSVNGLSDVVSVAYCNGKWFILGTSNSKATLWFASNPNGPWTAKQITSDNSGSLAFKKIIFQDGLYVLIGKRQASSGASFYPVLFTATDPSGTWSMITLDDSKVKNAEPLGFQYADGSYYFITGSYLCKALIPNGEWSYEKIILDDDTEIFPNDLYISNGTFFVSNKSDTTTKYPYVLKGSFLPIINTDKCKNYIRAK